MLSKQNEYLKEAVSETSKINRDSDLREVYLRRKMAIMDERSQKKSYFDDGLAKGRKEGLAEGRKEGLAEGKERLIKSKEESAINAITLGLTNEQIHAITGISEKRIEDLRNQLTNR